MTDCPQGVRFLPAQYLIDIENGVVRTTFRGALTRCDVADYAARLRDDPAFRPHFFELITFEANPDIQLGYLDWHSLADHDPFFDRSKRAFVTHSGTALYGMIRMFQMARNDPDNIRIFETTEEAMLWLSSPLGFARAEGR